MPRSVPGPAPESDLPFRFCGLALAHVERVDLAIKVEATVARVATLDRESQNLLDVTLRAQDAAGTQVTVAAQHAGVAGARDLSSDVDVAVADRRWHLHVQAAARKLPGGITGLGRLVTGVGVLVGLLLAGLVWVLATGRSRPPAQVVRSTRDLTAAEASARRQAALLTAVLENISDGVTVVDANGSYLLRNPAARAMIGVYPDHGRPSDPAEHFGVFRPDGLTPFPTAELPMERAMAGEPSDQVEMVIRNPARPDGLVVTASARPMQTADGRTGAVAASTTPPTAKRPRPSCVPPATPSPITRPT